MGCHLGMTGHMTFDLSAIWGATQKMFEDFLLLLPNLCIGGLVLLIFVLIGKGARAVGARLAGRATRHRNIGLIIGRLAQWVLLLVGLLVALSIVFPSFQARDLIELLGIGTVAIGFAFRDILQNFLAGILLLITEPFRLGDQIVVGAFEGTVTNIETRATTIRTYDGRRVVIPNSKLFTESVLVNTALESRRMEYDVGIGVGDDIERAKALILDAVRGLEDVLQEPPPEVLVVDLADFSVKLRVWWWTAPPQRIHILEVRSRVLAVIKKTLLAHGIDLPFPTQQILFHDQTEETDGDRRLQREGWPAGPAQSTVPRPRRTGHAVLG